MYVLLLKLLSSAMAEGRVHLFPPLFLGRLGFFAFSEFYGVGRRLLSWLTCFLS
jgi:hypothetical protein